MIYVHILRSNAEFRGSGMIDSTEVPTTFLHALQQAPALLEAIVSSWDHERHQPEIASLRLISKQANRLAMQAVRGYSLRLTAQSSTKEPLLDVSKLLRDTTLQRLRVVVIIPIYTGWSQCRQNRRRQSGLKV